MNPGVLLCVGFLLAVILAFEIGVFRLACAMCRIPQPPAAKSIGLVLILLFVPALVDAVHMAILAEVYVATGYPLWEAGVVEFCLALPAHMLICSTLHAKMMRLRVRDCLGVWFVEKTIKLGLILGCAGLIALIVLANAANG